MNGTSKEKSKSTGKTVLLTAMDKKRRRREGKDALE
jgi:hypothetical protein